MNVLLFCLVCVASFSLTGCWSKSENQEVDKKEIAKEGDEAGDVSAGDAGSSEAGESQQDNPENEEIGH